MLELDFSQYQSNTWLRDWWKAVKGNFVAVQDAVNELDTDISDEAATRDRVDTAIMQNLTDEITARIAADSAEAVERERVDNLLFDNISDAAAALVAETSARQTADNRLHSAMQSADNELRGDLVDIAAAIAAEASAREAAESEIKLDITALQDASHIHGNKEIIDTITSEDVERWRELENQVTEEELTEAVANEAKDRVKGDEENKSYIEYLEKVCFGFSAELQNIYAAMGCTVYDGGLFGAPENDTQLDGGEIGEVETGVVDCGDFEPFRCSCRGSDAIILDGGGYDNVSGSVIDGGSLHETGGTVYDGGVYP